MDQYLRRYAEPETVALDGLDPNQRWSNVLVIPACNESPALLRPAPPCSGRSLLLLVINEPEDSALHVSRANESLAGIVRSQFERHWQSDPGFPGGELTLFHDPGHPRDVLMVDRFSNGRRLPQGGGVGHARKIGADLAASLIHRSHIPGPWIHCSDADVKLPPRYFSCVQDLPDDARAHSALVYPFYHRGDPGQGGSNGVILATQLYELSLRYYVAGMKCAGSPYAFHTIGSTMAVNAHHYAKARGFPKREAGEDFYLLNKLAKIAPVMELAVGKDCEPIEIEARRSDRVPFGTGAAVNRITAMTDPVGQYRFYHPLVFEALRRWHESLPAIWQARCQQLSPAHFPLAPDSGFRAGLRQSLVDGLKSAGADRALEHAFKQSRDAAQFKRQIHTWFDALRTLKLVHDLRDRSLASINYRDLVSNRFFQSLLEGDKDLNAFHRQLADKLTR